MRSEMLASLERIDTEMADHSAYARGLAKGPTSASLHDMERRYGVNLDENSHGQSFLKLFRSRFVPGGLYLLDEPEAPLSPQSQLALLAMIGDMVREDAQFIIATHSPILLGFPNATIYSCDSVPIEPVPFEELDHVVITREFLNAPGRFLRHLGEQSS
jgi:predicted ATPase